MRGALIPPEALLLKRMRYIEGSQEQSQVGRVLCARTSQGRAASTPQGPALQGPALCSAKESLPLTSSRQFSEETLSGSFLTPNNLSQSFLTDDYPLPIANSSRFLSTLYFPTDCPEGLRAATICIALSQSLNSPKPQFPYLQLPMHRALGGSRKVKVSARGLYRLSTR